MLYFDTSAILPYYRQEQASERVQALLEAQTQPVLISHLTEVEVASALARWVRMAELTEPEANRIESAFHDDVSHGRFVLCPIEFIHYPLDRFTENEPENARCASPCLCGTTPGLPN